MAAKCDCKNRSKITAALERGSRSIIFIEHGKAKIGRPQSRCTCQVMMRNIIRFNSVVMILLAAIFFIYPAVRATLDIRDPALKQPGTPKAAWRLFRNLTPRYANWANERVARGKAEGMSIEDISGTEWPVFGSAF